MVISGVLLQDSLSGFFDSLASALTLMNVIMLLNSAVFTVSMVMVLFPVLGLEWKKTEASFSAKDHSRNVGKSI